MVSASADPVVEDATVPSARICSGAIRGHSASVGFRANLSATELCSSVLPIRYEMVSILGRPG